jgi:hypothetical protein
MLRRFTAVMLSFLVLCAATVSLNEEVEPGELFANSAAEEIELAFASEQSAIPDYPDAHAQRLLRKRVSLRAFIGAKAGNVISASAYCSFTQSCGSHRLPPQGLYQHQTSLRI